MWFVRYGVIGENQYTKHGAQHLQKKSNIICVRLFTVKENFYV